MTYLFAAFGQPDTGVPGYPTLPGASNPGLRKDLLTVFEPSEFEPLWERIQALHAAKKPIVVRDHFTVVDNDYFGIKGGWKAEVIWVVQLPVQEWVSRLPSETSAHLPS